MKKKKRKINKKISDKSISDKEYKVLYSQLNKEKSIIFLVIGLILMLLGLFIRLIVPDLIGFVLLIILLVLSFICFNKHVKKKQNLEQKKYHLQDCYYKSLSYEETKKVLNSPNPNVPKALNLLRK